MIIMIFVIDNAIVVTDLETSEDDDSETLDEEDDNDNSMSQNYFAQLSLLQTPGTVMLGEWEKHTKVLMVSLIFDTFILIFHIEYQ